MPILPFSFDWDLLLEEEEKNNSLSNIPIFVVFLNTYFKKSKYVTSFYTL